jgi:hypothetical protein
MMIISSCAGRGRVAFDVTADEACKLFASGGW